MDELLKKNGYVVAKNFIDSTILTGLSQECRARISRIRVGFSQEFNSTRDVNAWLSSTLIRDFIFSGAIRTLLARYTNISSWRLYHSESIFKRPGDREIAWHQDQLFCPVDGDMFTVWIALSDVSSGCLQYARSSNILGLIHPQGKEGDLPDLPPQRATREELESRILAAELEIDTPDLRAGDAVIHAGCTLHRSEEHTGLTTREAMAIFVFPADAKICSDLSSLQWSQMKYFPGLLPRDSAASILNPNL